MNQFATHDEETYIFVYGLLRPTENLFDMVEEQVADIKDGAVLTGHHMYVAGLAQVVPANDEDAIVVGTLLQMKDNAQLPFCMGRLDRIECQYRREQVKVTHEGEEYNAWVYLWNDGPPRGKILADGDYLKHRRAEYAEMKRTGWV